MKTIFKNGKIIDGTGNDGFIADVVVNEGHIVAIGHAEIGVNDQVIDATGKVICPGFIDTHTHSDLSAIINPALSAKIRQGITTELLGQDGVALAPLPEQYIAAWRKNIAGLDGDTDKIDWKFKNTEGYLNLLEEHKPATNLAYLVPHGNVRMEAMGLEGKPSTREDVAKMCEILERELKAGAFGLSTGLIYMPCAFGDTAEMIELCKVTAKYDGLFVVHQRSEADDILTSTQELIDIAKASGVWLHISHMKVCGKKNWGLIDQMLGMLEQAQKEGIRISYDQYPYVAGSTMLGVILPPWVHSGGTDKLLERLESPELREKMIADIKQGIPGWDNFIDFAGLDQIFVTSAKTAKNQDAVGLNLIQLGELRGKDPYNATFDLLYEEDNAVGMVDFYGTEEHVIKFLCRPEQNVCTDGLMGAGKPHPRVFGAFPRVLGKYVREENCLSWEAAIRKMTGKPAEVMGLKDRGLIKVGYAADIVMFNPETIMDKGTFIEPNQYPEGIDIVMVNGRLALINGIESYACSGSVIRKTY
ncbi:N-acyl-D-amino-acid deacylase family protein [Budvicia aquatica]|uniref:N-acyl-D-amino-acid deacylase family protein n=1 Tax=Budvicia aquatica TaxID=82979 RepID=UPI001B510512|nr:D-aminoacylase [Budvicia aquatica]MBP9642260.1 D-aminoacylase [Budvicia sp.]GKX53318.1 D-aminoacylase [Budvicia aquatica]